MHEPSTKVEARTAVRVAEVEDESAAVPEGLFSNEGLEPPHIYVQEGSKLAKFWLEAVELASSTGYAAHKLTKLRQLVETDQQFFLESWHEFFRS
ncbi:MAG: DUF4160 domain-containing protein [Acidobacteriota bacterium]|nr:MAG: DUF4160 domain-containing protein [Acidobacteriota bacterium]